VHTQRSIPIRIFFTVLAVTVAVAAGGPPPASSEGTKRTLFIVLDAIPYSAVSEITDPTLGAAALFQDFKGPVPMVSTFPSGTCVAIPGILTPFGVSISPGYEARYYDWQRNKVRGGGPISYYRIEFPWRSFFDVTRTGIITGGLHGLSPIRSSIKQLRKGIDRFIESEKDPFAIYIGETDLVMHFAGPEATERVFAAMEAKLEEVRQEHPDRPFDTVILSDHGVEGGAPLANVWKPVRKALKEAGYRYTKKLRRPTDVVLTPFGLVSNFEAYTREEAKPHVAEILADVPGVDFCVFETHFGWIVESMDGKAIFRRHPTPGGPCWSYEPLYGDPLEYLPLIDHFLQQTGRTSDCLPDEEWFEATAGCEYPDAFSRLAQSFRLVENPASVACSLRRGYMYGPRRTDLASKIADGPLRWTHGALHREATLGFLMSDVPGWNPPHVARFDTALAPFLETQLPNPKSTLDTQ
jgi:hypothetical protein